MCCIWPLQTVGQAGSINFMLDGRPLRSMSDLTSAMTTNRPLSGLPPDLMQRIVALENAFDPTVAARLVAVEDNLRQINVSCGESDTRWDGRITKHKTYKLRDSNPVNELQKLCTTLNFPSIRWCFLPAGSKHSRKRSRWRAVPQSS